MDSPRDGFHGPRVQGLTVTDEVVSAVVQGNNTDVCTRKRTVT
jgi:hypothetical protein